MSNEEDVISKRMWYVFHPSKPTRVIALHTSVSMLDFFSFIPKKMREQFMVRRNSWDEFISASQIPQIADNEDDINSSSISHTRSVNYQEQRVHERFNLRIRILIHVDGQYFVNYSDNISLGGLKLVKPLPTDSLHNSNCRVYVVEGANLDRIIELSGKILIDSDNCMARLEFFEKDNEKLKVFIESIIHKTKASAPRKAA